MFTKPIDEITFVDIESFCKEWAEGVRVEYKRKVEDIKGHIPKIVSSFANFYGGIFLIGVEADKTKNEVIFPIQGIPETPGIEEQIQQSTLTGIYPGVIPQIKLVDVPDSKNVVVVVRVDESVQAPHAIEGSTQVYIRTGCITQPYELSDMDRIAYMLKHREDSQAVARQILNRIEERVSNVEPSDKIIGDTLCLVSNFPTFTVIARPVFPYRPLTSASNIHESHRGPLWPPRRVTGGNFCYNEEEYWELNEYGIVYYRVVLFIQAGDGIDYGIFLSNINELIQRANSLYVDCGYIGNIDVTVQLQRIYGKKLLDTEGYEYGRKITEDLDAEPMTFDTEILTSKQCLARDLEDEKERKDIVEELTCQLLWAFNIPVDQPTIREKIRKRIERNL